MSAITLRRIFWQLSREESAAAATEYAILVAFVAAAVSLAVSQFSLIELFTELMTRVQVLF
ncbi:hypothetical protein [Zoogloea sp.]|uniref:Flp family type IVb pilin n=1 Tax=Zoogloea sp. TaxID=49181 RepID=UPI001416DFBE|nr:MAG: hypothetical protein F9K15_00385 [Zoogloea sp.]